MINVTVAGSTFGIQTAKREAMLRIMEDNYAPFLAPDGMYGEEIHPLFTIDIDRRVSIPEEKPLKIFEYTLTDDNAVLRIFPGYYILSILNSLSGETFSVKCPLHCSPASGQTGYEFTADLTIHGIAPPRHILDHILIFAFSVAGASRNVLLIHASTIVYNGSAVMFLGESGTGKSTHSRMWLESIQGTSLLNDDAPAVRISDDGTAVAYGTPWSGKTPCYRNEAYPLAAMTRIKRAPYNLISRQKPVPSFGAVLPSCLPTLQQDETMLDNVCNTLSSLLSSVPVYILECLPNTDAAKVACGNIFTKR